MDKSHLDIPRKEMYQSRLNDDFFMLYRALQSPFTLNRKKRAIFYLSSSFALRGKPVIEA